MQASSFFRVAIISLFFLLTSATANASPSWNASGPWVGGAGTNHGGRLCSNFAYFASAEEAALKTCQGVYECGYTDFGQASGISGTRYQTATYQTDPVFLSGPVFYFSCVGGIWDEQELGVQMDISANTKDPGIPPDIADPSPAKPEDKCDAVRGNPVNAATCDKLQVETDFIGTETFPLKFERYYRSANVLQETTMGPNWRHTYSRRVSRTLDSSAASVVRAEGRTVVFRLSAGVWTSDRDVNERLTQTVNGWDYTDRDGNTETYDSTGRLLTVTNRRGLRHTLIYSDASTPTNIAPGPGYLIRVLHSFGNYIDLTYNSTGRLATMRSPSGATTSYQYDDLGNLAAVTRPDLVSTRLYHYRETGLLPEEGRAADNALTGITDETGNRYATFSYVMDTTGATNKLFAASTEHAGGMERFSINYNSSSVATITDAVGTAEVLTFSTTLGVRNLISKTNQADGKVLTQTFDSNNNLTCRQDEEGRVTTYSYNTANQMSSMTEGLTGTCAAPQTTTVSRTTNYEYLSPSLDLPTLITSPSVRSGQTRRVEITYTNNLPTSFTVRGFTTTGTAISRTVAFTYNANGQVATINGPRTDVNDVTTLAYYSCTTGFGCGRLQSVQNALGHTTTYDLYDADGRVLQVTEPNGTRTNYEYDLSGRLLTVTLTPPVGSARITRYTYTPAGNIDTITSADGVDLTYVYDAAGMLRTITDNSGNRVAYGYDLKGNRTDEGAYDPDGTLVREIHMDYDVRNFLSSVNFGGSITQYLYDAVGNLRQKVDPQQVATSSGLATVHQYDSLNRLIETVNNLGGLTSYSYDVNGYIRQILAPNTATTQFLYNDLGDLEQEVSPDRGTTRYTYDNAGNVITEVDARNITIAFTYDALNRVTTINPPGTAEDVTLTYDSGTNCSYGTGRICRVIDQSGTTNYAYDPFGNVVTVTRTELGVTYTTSYSYDAGNRVATITYPDGRVATYARTAGRLTSVSLPVNGASVAVVAGRNYRADGLILSQAFGNGLNEASVYDLRGLLQQKFIGSADTKIYSYDANGNVTQEQSLPQIGNYVYDANDRLTQDQTVAGTTTTTNFTYNANDNRTTKGNVTYTIGANNNRVTRIGKTKVMYDSTGNITRYQNRYTYNQTGRLATVRVGNTVVGTYIYDFRGLRTRKASRGATTIYHYDLDGNVLAETTSAGVLTKLYVYADGEPVAQITRTGSTDSIAYLHTDNEGTPRLATSSTQAVIWRWQGSAFGDSVAQNDPDGNGIVTVINLRFPGQYYDSESGLHYNWNRYYHPVIGRYITSDPIGIAGGLNTYNYSMNNPMTLSDPLGLYTIITGCENAPTFSARLACVRALNGTPAGARIDQLHRLGERFQRQLKCHKDERVQKIFDRWVVEVNPNIDHASARFGTTEGDTNFSTQRTIFNRKFFIGGNQYFTFAHEFRHLMPENNALMTPSYLRDRFTGSVAQHPIEVDADKWARKFIDKSCSCDN